MASSEALTGRPRSGEVVKVAAPARARAIELIKNRRRQYGGDVCYPPYCGRGFSETVTVRPLAGPRFCAFRTAFGLTGGRLWMAEEAMQ